MSDLATFLLARIAEIEVLARAYIDRAAIAGTNRETWAYQHLLRECEAKRRIVDWHDRSHECSGPSDRHGGDIDISLWFNAPESCPTMLALASVYQDHPDFRAEWNPDA